MPFRKTENQLKDYIFILFLVVGIPYIIGQVIYEQWGGVGCLAPLVGCGALFGLLALVSTFKEDNGDTKISFEPPARDEKSHEMAVAMVRQMVGKQIRLVSVHWSDSERDEYLKVLEGTLRAIELLGAFGVSRRSASTAPRLREPLTCDD